jgi:methyl-accepting chemotaxis protein
MTISKQVDEPSDDGQCYVQKAKRKSQRNLRYVIKQVWQVKEFDKGAAYVGEILVASNERATGIAQIDKGLAQFSLVVQKNSATSEQSARQVRSRKSRPNYSSNRSKNFN